MRGLCYTMDTVRMKTLYLLRITPLHQHLYFNK